LLSYEGRLLWLACQLLAMSKALSTFEVQGCHALTLPCLDAEFPAPKHALSHAQAGKLNWLTGRGFLIVYGM